MQNEPDVTKAMILREIILGNDMRKNLMHKFRKEGLSRNRINYNIGDKQHGLIAKGVIREKNNRFLPQRNFKALVETVRILRLDTQVKDYVRGALVHWVAEAYDSPHGDLALTELKEEWHGEQSSECEIGTDPNTDLIPEHEVRKGGGQSFGYRICTLRDEFDLERPWTIEPEKILEKTRGPVDLNFCIAYFLVCWDMQDILRDRMESGIGPYYSEVNTRFLFNKDILDRASGIAWENVGRDIVIFGYRRLVEEPLRAYRDKIKLEPGTYNEYLSEYNRFEEESELKDFNERMKFLLNVNLDGALRTLEDGGIPRQDEYYKEYEY